jgi:hypothetical protein
MSSLREISSSGAGGRREFEFGRPFAIATLAGLAILGVAGIGWLATNRSFGYFTRDPAAITREAPYIGLVSFVGLFAWVAGATALVCAGYVASLRGARDRRNALFLVAAAVVYLLLDDAFEFHEYYFPRYIHLSDSVLELGYVVGAVVAVVKGRDFFSSTNVRLLAAAGIFFATSITLDAVIDGERLVALEDGAKLIGIFLLAVYCLDTALLESRLTFRELNRG